MTLPQFDTYAEVTELERHTALIRSLRGEQAMGWAEWAIPIYEPLRPIGLTAQGRVVAQWAVGILGRFLGSDFFAKSPQDAFALLYALNLWPGNNVPIAYWQLIQLAAQIALLGERDAPLQKSMRTNLTPYSWLHHLLQLDLGALAMRAGWDVRFEPQLGNSNNKADVELTYGEATLIVEIAPVGTPRQVREADASFVHLYEGISSLRMKYDVQVYGKTGRPGSVEENNLWLRDLETAANAVRDGEQKEVPGPTGGSLNVVKGEVDVALLTIESDVEESDVLGQIHAKFTDKVNQTQSSSSIWLYLKDGAGLWFFTPLQGMSLSEKLAVLTQQMQKELQAFPNIAGVILSPGPMWAADAETNHRDETLRTTGGSIGAALRVYLPQRRVRETILVARSSEHDSGLATFRYLYEEEGTWLDWALEQLGHPPMNALVTP